MQCTRVPEIDKRFDPKTGAEYYVNRVRVRLVVFASPADQSCVTGDWKDGVDTARRAGW